jgi:hypothetical protein
MNKIEPTCEVCGKRLVKVASGLLCIEGHGRILPNDEFTDRNVLPSDHSHCERMIQIPLSVKSLGAIYKYRLRVEG